MKIELYIDGDKKLFTTPVIPMLAKRMYLEIEARAEERARKEKEAGNETYFPTAQEQLDEDDEMVSILADVVFNGQFTVEQLYKGAANEYVYAKLAEAVFGKKKKENDSETGNVQGE